MTIEKIEFNLLEKDQLQKLYETIKPTLRINGKLYFLRAMSSYELSHITFWDFKRQDLSKAVAEEEVEEVTTIEMLHEYDFYARFVPSVAEILSQIPEDLRDSVCAFEIAWYPQSLGDLLDQKAAIDKHFHMSKVRLYKKK